MHWIEPIIYVAILLSIGIYVGRMFWQSHLMTKRMKRREAEYAKLQEDAKSGDPKIVDAAAKRYMELLDEKL